jgi:hypothetical protein
MQQTGPSKTTNIYRPGVEPEYLRWKASGELPELGYGPTEVKYYLSLLQFP